MKKSLRKQALLLTVVGLSMTGLVFFNVVWRQNYERKIGQIEVMHTAIASPLAVAKTNYLTLPADTDPNVTSKLVREPIESVRVYLQDLYNGKNADLQTQVASSESVMILIKLAIVETERTLELIAKKENAEFDRVTDTVGKLEAHFRNEAKAQYTTLTFTSWLSVVGLLIVFLFIIIWNYLSDKRRMEQSSHTDERLSLESKRVETLSGFIEAMASGNYSIELDTNKNDDLTSTLITMRDKLKLNAEEDQRRNWATSGLAQIGQILRASSNTSADLYDSIVKFVVRYTKSNQAGLFIINDDDTQNSYLELLACYAFERKKFLTKRVEPGQGLVGQCFLEAEKIHLRDVPTDYVRITSGLGGENPRSCLLVPLKINEKIYGVLELASFGLYQEYEIELIEKLAESIASTISSVRINESTRTLLERTQQQAEEMKSQEEEMRQNMEELSATQEEMQRKEGEYLKRIQELEELQAV